MPDSDLARVEKDIEVALRQIARQRIVVERLRAGKIYRKGAERLLASMQETLKHLRADRRMIEDDLTDAKTSSRF